MNSKDYSRRDFLRTFAALSAAPLLAGVLSGCGRAGTEQVNQVEHGTVALYGPSPTGVMVNGMVFLDAQSNQVQLSGNQAVPVHTSFVIQFGGLMNVASIAAAITFVDSSNNPVAFAASADQNAQYSVNITVTPTADLLPNTNYTLSINDTATDSYGNKLVINANASAPFRTAT